MSKIFNFWEKHPIKFYAIFFTIGTLLSAIFLSLGIYLIVIVGKKAVEEMPVNVTVEVEKIEK